MTVTRRDVLAGVSIPAAAGLAWDRLPGGAAPEQVPGLPTFTDAIHNIVLTGNTADALGAYGIGFSPTAGSTPVPGAIRPSTRLALSVGSASLDLLTGVLHFDGGFALTSEEEQGGTPRRLAFTSFATQLATGTASSLLWIDGEPEGRIDTATFDLSDVPMEADPPELTVGSFPVHLTARAIDAIREVFPGAPVHDCDPAWDGSGFGTFTLPDLP